MSGGGTGSPANPNLAMFGQAAAVSPQVLGGLGAQNQPRPPASFIQQSPPIQVPQMQAGPYYQAQPLTPVPMTQQPGHFQAPVLSPMGIQTTGQPTTPRIDPVALGALLQKAAAAQAVQPGTTPTPAGAPAAPASAAQPATQMPTGPALSAAFAKLAQQQQNQVLADAAVKKAEVSQSYSPRADVAFQGQNYEIPNLAYQAPQQPGTAPYAGMAGQ